MLALTPAPLIVKLPALAKFAVLPVTRIEEIGDAEAPLTSTVGSVRLTEPEETVAPLVAVPATQTPAQLTPVSVVAVRPV